MGGDGGTEVFDKDRLSGIVGERGDDGPGAGGQPDAVNGEACCTGDILREFRDGGARAAEGDARGELFDRAA